MSAETFIQLAEQGGFLEPKITTKLRDKLAGSSKVVTADELAELLVRRNVISDAQSESLLKATHAAAVGELQLEENFNLGPSRRLPDTDKSLELLDEKEDVELKHGLVIALEPRGCVERWRFADIARRVAAGHFATIQVRHKSVIILNHQTQ